MTKSKSKIITLLLCIFLGYLGIHRFYTGYAWLGILYLLTGGILGIGIIVDLIFIIFGGYEDADGNSLNEIGVDINNPIYSGGIYEDEFFEPRSLKYLRQNTITRLVPESIKKLRFKGSDTLASMEYFGHQFIFNEEEGLLYIKFKAGQRLEALDRENRLNLEYIRSLSHEFTHQVTDGDYRFRMEYLKGTFNYDDIIEFNKIINEGNTELLNRIAMQFYNQETKEHSYPNYVALVFHLLKNVAEKYGRPGNPNNLKALLLFVDQASHGGTKRDFAVICRSLRTRSFPTGFDLYQISDTQNQRIKQFFSQNNKKQTDFGQFIKTLRRQV